MLYFDKKTLITIIIIKPPKEKGKNPFHTNLINQSYRTRGKDPRTQIKTTEKKKVIIHNKKSLTLIKKKEIEKNKILVTKLIAIIFKYSPIKIKANPPALYSVLNPDTNSLSPSLKSKGVRFVSANLLVNQKTKKKGRLKKKENSCLYAYE